MKIGDKFKLKYSSSDNVYKLISVAFTSDVAVLMCNGSVLLPSLRDTVDDPQNITKEDFCKIWKVSEDALKCFTDVDGSPLFQEVTYAQGDIFEVKEAKYESNIGLRLMLSQVGYSEVCLIAVSGDDRGNRFSTPIKVNSPSAVTEEELRRMCGNTLQRIERV